MQKINSNNVTQESPNELSHKSVSIGALLVNAREAASFAQADVAEQINLPKSIIQALETDDFDNLPQSTYIRGYLRNYARVVGIDADSLIKVYTEQYHQEPVVETARRSVQSYDPAILWSTVAVLSILVGLVITWWFDNHSIQDQAIDLASNQEVEVVEREAGERAVLANGKSSSIYQSNENSANENTEQSSQAAMPFEEDAQNPMEVSETNAGEPITADQQQAMEKESQNPTLIASVEGADVITVTYTEKSWTEIRDADANILMQGLIEPGVVRNLSGNPPFEIFLGNAPGVVIEVNGLYFDHSQYNRSNRTARFQVSSGSLN